MFSQTLLISDPEAARGGEFNSFVQIMDGY